MSVAYHDAPPIRARSVLQDLLGSKERVFILSFGLGMAALSAFSATRAFVGQEYSVAAMFGFLSLIIVVSGSVVMYSDVSRTRQSEASLLRLQKQQQHLEASIQVLRTERAEAEGLYQRRVAEVESAFRSSVWLPEPAIDPGVVVDRVSDLGLDVTAKVEPDGAVIVTLRRGPNEISDDDGNWSNTATVDP